ncbi:chemotaxis protein CheD [Marinicrinis lubricantis]|uniref:Probable chemoreceptor glutamine deamidase CheD n=1 Tax=Marinicrinis lubricantis TaxID=2086470 RepID=A0ABW1IME4_9BACL
MTELQLIKVGMADLNATNEDRILRTTGLGSCVGLTLFDPLHKVAGLAHIMLPSSSIAREGQLNKAKYADTAIPELIDRMLQLGANKGRLEAKLAGGAQMFSFNTGNDMMKIGPRNVDSCKEILAQLHIPIRSEDTGGNYGRTIEISNDTGMLTVKSVNKGIKEI